LAAVKFTVDEEGRIVNPHLFWTSEDEKVDDLMLETVCDMPNWEPATYAKGQKIQQDYALMIGNFQSCVTNVLNVQLNY